MGHHTLQLFAVQVVQRALGDSHHRIGLIPARRKGIDGWGARQHHHFGHWHMGGNAQLLHDIAQALFCIRAAGPRLAGPNTHGQLDAASYRQIGRF